MLSNSLVSQRKGFGKQRKNFSSASVLIITNCKLMERTNEISWHSIFSLNSAMELQVCPAIWRHRVPMKLFLIWNGVNQRVSPLSESSNYTTLLLWKTYVSVVMCFLVFVVVVVVVSKKQHPLRISFDYQNEWLCGSFLKAEWRKTSFQKAGDTCSSSLCGILALARVLMRNSTARGRACTGAASLEVCGFQCLCPTEWIECFLLVSHVYQHFYI